MKKKVLFGSIVSALILGGAVAVGATDDGIADGKKKLSIEEIEKKVLSEKSGVIESIELDRENNKLYYEVEFENDRDDDDIYVDAYSGEIFYDDLDDDNDKRDDDDDNDDRNNKEESVVSEGQKKLLSKEEAIKIAEKAVDGKVYSFEKDEDDGFYHYELELKSKQGEVDVEMDASSGEIIEIDYDDRD